MTQVHPSLAKKIRKEHALEHFFYKAEPVVPLKGYFKEVVDAVDEYTATYGLGNPSNIEVLTAKEIGCEDNPLFKRYGAMFDGLSAKPPEIVFCSWACPHIDEMFEGNGFVSLVLATGASPYTVSSLAMKKPRGKCAELNNAAYQVYPGDLLVMDPLVPHWAVPSAPADDSLLVLLQCMVPFATESEQMAVYERFSPKAGLRKDGFD